MPAAAFPAGPISLQTMAPAQAQEDQTAQLAAQAEAQKAQEEQQAQMQELQVRAQQLEMENQHLKNQQALHAEHEKARAEIAREREKLLKEKKDSAPMPEAPRAQKLDPHTFIGMRLSKLQSRINALSKHRKAAAISLVLIKRGTQQPGVKPATGFLGGVEKYINGNPDYFKTHSIPGLGNIPGVNRAADWVNNNLFRPVAYHAYKAGDSFGQGHYGDAARHTGAYLLNAGSLVAPGIGSLGWTGRGLGATGLGMAAGLTNPDPYSSALKVGDRAVDAQDELNKFTPKPGALTTAKALPGGIQLDQAGVDPSRWNRNGVDNLQVSGYYHPEVFGQWQGAENARFSNPLLEFGTQMAAPFILPQVDMSRNQNMPVSGFARSPLERLYQIGQVADPAYFHQQMMTGGGL